MIFFQFKKTLPENTHIKTIERDEYLIEGDENPIYIETWTVLQNTGVDSYKDKPCIIVYNILKNKITHVEWRERGTIKRKSSIYPNRITLKDFNKIKLCYEFPNTLVYQEVFVDGTEITEDLYCFIKPIK